MDGTNRIFYYNSNIFEDIIREEIPSKLTCVHRITLSESGCIVSVSRNRNQKSIRKHRLALSVQVDVLFGNKPVCAFKHGIRCGSMTSQQPNLGFVRNELPVITQSRKSEMKIGKSQRRGPSLLIPALSTAFCKTKQFKITEFDPLNLVGTPPVTCNNIYTIDL